MKKHIFRRLIEAPAVMTDLTLTGSRAFVGRLSKGKAMNRAKAAWNLLGPGLTTGASDDDPAGIATYSQTGAQYGFQFLWLSFFTFPLMAFVQEMCARIGLVTGRGLAANIREYFSKRVLIVCTLFLFCANTFNLGADLGAMAQATQLLFPEVPYMLLVILFALSSLGFQIFMSYERYARYLKWLALVLLSYVVTAFLVDIDWTQVSYHMFVPKMEFTKDQIFLFCAILGTTISPYLFFWQTAQEIEEKKSKDKKLPKILREQPPTKQEIRDMRIDVWSGMFFSNLAMFFIIATCGAVLFPHGITSIETAADAAEALRPFAGDATYLVFTLGIVGTGLLAIPILAGSAAYAICESYRWKNGLMHRLKDAYAFYGVIILSVLVGLAMNFFSIDPIKALIYSAVANGIIAPMVLVFIVLISSSKAIMGEYVNHPVVTALGWFTTGIMALAGIAAIWSMLG